MRSRTQLLGALTNDLAELVAMPTVAGTSAGSVALDQSAVWLAKRLRAIGMERSHVTRKHGPAAVIAWKSGAATAPTILLYAHHDVVSARTFSAKRRGRLLCGRGASDDKGPLIAMLHALEEHLTTRTHPGVGIVVVVDGEEEAGSPHLAGLLSEAQSMAGRVDAVLAVDTQADANGVPALTTSLRGQTTVDLDVRGPAERHSGRFGGRSPDPGLILSAILSALASSCGTVRGMSPGDLSVSVNALCSDHCVVGPHHVIPETVRAKLNFRFGYSDAGVVLAHLTAVVRSQLVVGTEAWITPWLAVRPWALAAGRHRLVAVVTDELTTRFGEPRRLSSAATLPLASVAEDVLGLRDIALIGFGLASDNAHAENEQVDVLRLVALTGALTAILQRFGESR